MSLLLSALYLFLHIAVICLIAAAILWVLKWVGIGIDPWVYKAGSIVVALLIIIAIVAWLSGLGTGYPYPLWR